MLPQPILRICLCAVHRLYIVGDGVTNRLDVASEVAVTGRFIFPKAPKAHKDAVYCGCAQWQDYTSWALRGSFYRSSIETAVQGGLFLMAVLSPIGTSKALLRVLAVVRMLQMSSSDAQLQQPISFRRDRRYLM